jgi:hypothetical protein
VYWNTDPVVIGLEGTILTLPSGETLNQKDEDDKDYLASNPKLYFLFEQKLEGNDFRYVATSLFPSKLKRFKFESLVHEF